MSATAIQAQAAADLFEADAPNWDAYYERSDVFSVIHQLRRSLALAWVDELDLRPGAWILELGCGTGRLAVSLAQRGYQVTAVDGAAAMLRRARANVVAAGVEESVALIRGDAERLPVLPNTYDLVIALGLVPWLASPVAVLGEMMTSLAPRGHALVNCDNRHRLPALLDPRSSPPLAGGRALAKKALRHRRSGISGHAGAIRHSSREFDRLLTERGARVVRVRTFGFGPFTWMGKEVLRGTAGVALHRSLDRLASLGMPGLRSTGMQYLVLAARL